MQVTPIRKTNHLLFRKAAIAIYTAQTAQTSSYLPELATDAGYHISQSGILTIRHRNHAFWRSGMSLTRIVVRRPRFWPGVHIRYLNDYERNDKAISPNQTE